MALSVLMFFSVISVPLWLIMQQGRFALQTLCEPLNRLKDCRLGRCGQGKAWVCQCVLETEGCRSIFPK